MTATRELWVCFDRPESAPPPHVVIVSFLTPGSEAALEEQFGHQIVSGRAVVQETRPRARAEYVRLIAQLGTSVCSGGRTLRQELEGAGSYSRWWLLDITEKDCLSDADTVYLTLLWLTAIEAVRERYGARTVRFFGAPPDLVAAAGRAPVWVNGIRDLLDAVARGVASRARLFAEYVRLWWTLRRLQAPPAHAQDVLLHGYWDWTVHPDGTGTLRDRYFADLPDQLRARGVRVGWLASVEPNSTPGGRRRCTSEVIGSALPHDDVVLLERFLSFGDIVRGVINVRHALIVTRAVARRQFRRLCRTNTFDVSPLIRRLLLRAAWGGMLCRFELIAVATARACRQIRPAALLSSFELFVRARPVYAGVRAASARTAIWAAQHAGYSSDKTLGIVEPATELHGEPDGCAMPAPDGIFAMGELSARIWRASGFPADRVAVTGGLRYQHVRAVHLPEARKTTWITVLLAGGVGEAPHIDLCDAVLSAVAGASGIRLEWRDHPHYVFSQRPAFARFRNAISVSERTLDEDLRHADLVIFSQSGVGEEALLRGIPTWQWLWAGFNVSPFVDLPVIPAFTSVAALKQELRCFVENPSRYTPAIETQRQVLRECFGPDPRSASARIAEMLQLRLDRVAGAPA